MAHKPAPQKYGVGSLESFVQMLKSLRRKDRQRSESSTYVFVEMGSVVAKLDEQMGEDRSDGIHLGLQTSDSWSRIRKMSDSDENSGWYTQKDLLSLLEYGIEAKLDPSNLAETVKTITFSHLTTGKGTVDDGKYDISRATSAEMTGTGKIPKTVKAEVVVWDNVSDGAKPLARTVELALVTDPVSGRFRFVPKAGQVERAEANAMEWVRERLASQLSGDAEVFVGPARN